MKDDDIKLGDKIYYARAFPNVGLYEIVELKIRTINKDNPDKPWYVGTYRSGSSFLFTHSQINTDFFFDRQAALAKVKETEKNGKHFSKSENEDDYE